MGTELLLQASREHKKRSVGGQVWINMKLNNHTQLCIPYTHPSYNNNINLVKHCLETMTLEDINKMEPNGSTALHIAVYRGYEKILELLLEKVASQILNFIILLIFHSMELMMTISNNI
jgi:ankyrin repeat protein